MTPSPTSLITEVDTAIKKLEAQVVTQVGAVAIIIHTNFTKIEDAATVGVAAVVGYVINRIRKL